ncbi:MAG: Ig-like domain-containing protein [Tannerella sp.]|jgi:hypothetical protein|nr:Ig-like domain-containing protein [Tannerella sp.]
MAKVKGVCKNIDEECSRALRREVQEVEKSAPFVCEECGKPLVAATGKAATGRGGSNPPANKNRLILIGLLIVALVAGGGGAAWFFFGAQSPKIKSISLTPTQLELTVGESATLRHAVEPADVPAEGLLWSSSDAAVASVLDGEVTALAAGEAQITLSTFDRKVSAKSTVTVSEPPVVEDPPAEGDVAAALNGGVVQGNENGVGRISTPLGNYNGDLKNGKASGNGTFEFFKAGLISRKDPLERVSKAGDVITGQFVNNEVVQVTWLDEQQKQKDVITVGSTGIPESSAPGK